MEKIPIYQKIIEEIRQDILEGRLQSGDRLPTVREMMRQQNCTSGTVQRAYQELLRQGLITSQPGKGTHISGRLDLGFIQSQAPLRLANMVHRAEAFLLDSITAGYSLAEVQSTFNIALDRWRVLQEAAAVPRDPQVIRFAGSHDMAMVWLSEHMEEIAPGASLPLTFAGSLHGLMILAEGNSEIAGCHLWDEESNTYNEPYLRRLFPGKRMAIIHLANRKIGFIVAPGNPHQLRRLEDLTHPGVRFINRQSGSGTRVWLDATLQKTGIEAQKILGYANEKSTHAQLAQEIAENRADVGIGLESAAAAYRLGFVPLVEECYDLVTFAGLVEHPILAKIILWMNSAQGKEKLSVLPGYDFRGMGKTRFLSF